MRIMLFINPAVIVGSLSVMQSVSGLSHSVSLPLTRSYNAKSADSLLSTFEEIVDSTEFFVQNPGKRGACSVPAFGGAKVTFGANCEGRPSSPATASTPSEFVLKVDDATEDDFGWICTKFNECESMFDGVDTAELQDVVDEHIDNQQLLSAGYDAADARLAGSNEISNLFDDQNMRDLENNGFVVVDTFPKVSSLSNNRLSEFLVEKSTQNNAIRTDTVAFLDREDALSCGLEHHFDVMMGIASHLNGNINFRPWPYAARLPATEDKPLTNPGFIQAAEYLENDFYIAHRDNSLTPEGFLSNHRHYTCILYCNEDWTEQDGGALRIYPNSQHIKDCDDAMELPFVDVTPKNGNLLIFDSMLVHSVEKVIQSEKPRRALTLWINRPDKSGIRKNDVQSATRGRSWKQ